MQILDIHILRCSSMSIWRDNPVLKHMRPWVYSISITLLSWKWYVPETQKLEHKTALHKVQQKVFLVALHWTWFFFQRVQIKVPEFYTFIHSGPWTALWKLVGNLTRKTNIQQSFNPMYTEWWTIHLSLPKLQATKKTKNRQMVYKLTLKSFRNL